MNASDLWAEFARKENITADCDAWCFGDDADLLAQLVLQGVKTATASSLPLYQLEGKPIPEAGSYSVVLNSREEAVCIIQNQRVFVVPFDEVDQRQAWKEGEGDRSLAYWRRVHERFFREEMSAAGLEFDEKMAVVCEEFLRLYP